MRLTTVRRRAVAVVACGLLLAACGGTEAPSIADEDLGASPSPVEQSSPDGDPGTASPSPSPTTVPSPSPEASPSPPSFAEVCAGREDEAFIEVLTPVADTTVPSTFTVTGCGNTFEATYQWRVERPDGSVDAEGFGTMSCGTGCVGEFSQEVTVSEPGQFTLVVFETDARDGSETNAVEVPFTVA